MSSLRLVRLVLGDLKPVQSEAGIPLLSMPITMLSWAGLLPSFWSRSSESQVPSGFFPLECMPCPKRGEYGSNWGPCAHRELKRCLCWCPQLHSDALHPFPWCVHPRSSARLWCGVARLVRSLDWGLGSGRYGCRNWGGCTSVRYVGCLTGSILPGPLCPRSNSKMCCGVSGGGMFAPSDWGVQRGSSCQFKGLSTLIIGAKMCALLVCRVKAPPAHLSVPEVLPATKRSCLIHAGTQIAMSRLWLNQIAPQGEGLSLQNFSVTWRSLSMSGILTIGIFSVLLCYVEIFLAALFVWEFFWQFPFSILWELFHMLMYFSCV